MKNTSKSTITLQTRGVELEVKEKAEKQARGQGFSSLQDAVRVFIYEYANGNLSFQLGKAIDEYLSGNYIEIKPGEDINAKLLED